jgi:signal transduction histidine kinase/CheY-like chemotaxis protein
MAAVREQSGLVFEATHRARDGSLVPVEVSSRFLPSEGVFVSIVRDLTSRKRAEEELRRTQEQLQHSQRLESIGRLAGGVAHDFNNLLGVIIGYTEMVHGTLGPSHPSSSRLKNVLAAAQRAGGLTRQLLAFSRRQVLTPRILDLNAEIAALAAMLRRVIGDDIELDIRCDAGLGRVRADSGQVSQVILNLAVNARDAMPRGGRLTIETMNLDVDEAYAHAHPPISPGPYVCVRVRDDGSGMPESVRERCFEPFFTTKEGLGSGLGLATVYGIVKQSDGFIRVESSPGSGTTFTIELPRVEGDPEQTAKSTAVAPEGRGEAILLVEDEEQVRELARTVLQEAGYEVVAASHGVEALRLADTLDRPLHLLLSDIAMPGMNGYELAERLRLMRPGLRILLMSGHAPAAVGQAGAPVAPILEKPFDRVTLLQHVREAFSSDHRSL